MSQTEAFSAEHRWLLEELGKGFGTAVESMGSDVPRCAVSQATTEPAQDAEVESAVYDLNLAGGPALQIRIIASAWKEIGSRVLTAVGMDSPTEQLCLETYREVLGQAVALLGQSLGSRLKKEAVFVAAQSTSSTFDSGIPSALELAFGAQPPILLHVRMAASLPGLLAAPEPVLAQGGTKAANGLRQEGLGTLEELEMGVTVSLGTARLTMAEAMTLGPGSVVQLSAKLDDLVLIKVDGKVVARGEVVEVDGSYAVRITHLADLQAATISDRSLGTPAQSQLQRVFTN